MIWLAGQTSNRLIEETGLCPVLLISLSSRSLDNVAERMCRRSEWFRTITIASVPDASALSSFFFRLPYSFHRLMSFRPRICTQKHFSKKFYTSLVACKKQRDARPHGFKNRIKKSADRCEPSFEITSFQQIPS